LLNAVDLSTYGLERTALNQKIGLDDSESQVDPQNPNPRGAHGAEEEIDELDLIVRSFNERWFQGWDATPEDQKTKLVSFASNIKSHKDYEMKVTNNPDKDNSDLALWKIFEEVSRNQRKNDMSLYRLLAQDDNFKKAMFDSMKRVLKA
jgi:type I restriction enzyme R subunit